MQDFCKGMGGINDETHSMFRTEVRHRYGIKTTCDSYAVLSVNLLSIAPRRVVERFVSLVHHFRRNASFSCSAKNKNHFLNKCLN